MWYSEGTQQEVWASALWEVMKNTVVTNLFLSSPLLKEHPHTMMEESGNGYLAKHNIQVFLFSTCKNLLPLERKSIDYTFLKSEKLKHELGSKKSKFITSLASSHIPSNANLGAWRIYVKRENEIRTKMDTYGKP